MTTLALRTSRTSNGVSHRHVQVARAMWQYMWPRRAVDEVPITHVTNGVHSATWMAAKMQELLCRHLGLDWMARILSNSARPVQVVIAGKAHPQDEDAKRTLQAVLAVRHQHPLHSHIVFLEDYDLHLATRMIAGTDLWINLPRPPMEASGTSGMKVACNGGLNLSILDGWWEEGYDGKLGGGIRSPQAAPSVQDDHDATAMFDLLENEIIPLFYDRDHEGIPHRWLSRVKHSMQQLIPTFSAARMVLDYVERIYPPD